MTDLFERHLARLNGALEAIARRHFWSPFQESPSRRLHPDGAADRGKRAFEQRLQSHLGLDLPETEPIGAEMSPYTLKPLGVTYPKADPDQLYPAMQAALPAWQDAGPRARTGVCLEMLEQWHQRTFENAYATVHTAGQSFMMAFAGSGANSLDRGLEGLALAWQAMALVPESATFSRPFGRGPEVTLDKRYRLRGRGIALVITCASYPAWNAYPAILANLATGNPVVVKPHPDTILPMAIAVETGRAVLREAGFDPNLLTLAADTADEPVTKTLALDRRTAIIDFTGSPGFGQWLQSSCQHALVFTETAGTNTVILESTTNYEAMLSAVAQSICLFSSQMCTAAQNIFIPADGIRAPDGRRTFHEVAGALASRIDALVEAHGPGLCGALASSNTLNAISRLRYEADDDAEVLTASRPIHNPDFPSARTASPLLFQVTPDARELYGREHFGPMAFVIKAEDRDAALHHATTDTRDFGSIANYVYSTDGDWVETAIDGYLEAGSSVGVNLLRQLPINYAAAYSDYHVTGLNPAGNACLADMAFVAGRFRITQAKIERPDA